MDTLKMSVRSTFITSLFIILICQTCIYSNEVNALEMKLKYKGELGSKGSKNGQFMFPHSLAVDNSGNHLCRGYREQTNSQILIPQ